MSRARAQLLWLSVVLASLSLLGCSASSGSDAATLELGDAIVREVGELRGLLGLNSLIFSGIGLALVWVTLRGIRRAVHVVWRLGLDSSRRLETTATGARVVLVALVVLFVLRRIASLAPILLTFTLLAAILLLGAAYARQLPSVLVGLSLLLRRRLRHGDRIHIANHSGTVREVGLAQLHLRRGDGATLFVPNRLLMEEVLTVEHAKNSEPVRVRIPAASPQHREQLELARRVALLSPYRVPGSPVELIEDDVEHRRYCIEIHTWSVRAAAEAREHLEQTLDSALAAQARTRE
ncbi:MAG: mechanosensitive ion channel [Polyangiaceae bacterium]